MRRPSVLLCGRDRQQFHEGRRGDPVPPTPARYGDGGTATGAQLAFPQGDRNHISWVSPLGHALLKSAAGDSVELQAPDGTEYLDVLEVCYERISVERFREPLGSASSSGDPRGS